MTDFRAFFDSPFEQYRDRNGEPFTVVCAIDQADDDHDDEVLPMYRIRFQDGVEIEAWPEEVLVPPVWPS